MYGVRMSTLIWSSGNFACAAWTYVARFPLLMAPVEPTADCVMGTIRSQRGGTGRISSAVRPTSGSLVILPAFSGIVPWGSASITIETPGLSTAPGIITFQERPGIPS